MEDLVKVLLTASLTFVISFLFIRFSRYNFEIHSPKTAVAVLTILFLSLGVIFVSPIIYIIWLIWM